MTATQSEALSLANEVTSPARLLCEGTCPPREGTSGEGAPRPSTLHWFVRREFREGIPFEGMDWPADFPEDWPLIYACAVCGAERLWGCEG